MDRAYPNLALKGDWILGEDGWKDDMDSNLLKLSVFCQGRFIDVVAAEPGAPAEGDVYILDELHATYPNNIAVYDEAAWHYFAPLTGWRLFNITLGHFEQYDGTQWAGDAGTPFTEASNASIWQGDDSDKVLTPRRLYSSNEEIAVAYAAAITLDFDTGLNFGIAALTGNLTLNNPTNTKSGQSGFIFIPQDATGNRTLTLGNKFKFIGGVPVLSVTPNAIDVISYYVRANGDLACSLGKLLS